MPSDAQGEPPAKSGAVHETVEIVKTIVYALLIALALRIFLFQPFTIPSASMEPNLYQGDYIIVSKYSYGYSRHSIPFSPPIFSGRIFSHEPRRGDIIVFKLPRDGKTDYIKRLIGLPGDSIQVKQGVVYINGRANPRTAKGPGTAEIEGMNQPVERYLETASNGRQYLTNSHDVEGDVENTGVYVVPPNEYFFMGDNRDNSLDSRFPQEVGVGFVPAENLEGRAQLILLSWKPDASLFKPWTWIMDLRPSRFFHVLH
jgi:signal peptidase I